MGGVPECDMGAMNLLLPNPKTPFVPLAPSIQPGKESVDVTINPGALSMGAGNRERV
jgi:hypothetical protein